MKVHSKLSFLTCFVCVLLLTPLVSVLAQSPQATDSADLRRAIRERIEQTLQNSDETESPYVGYIGNVEQIGTTTFTLVTPRGENRTIQVSSNTVFVLGTSTIKLDELVVGNGVGVIGQEKDDLVIDALRVAAMNETLDETRQVAIGTITNVDTRSVTLQIRGSGTTESYSIDRKTAYEDSQGTTIPLRDLEVDQAALVVTEVNAQNQRFVQRLHLLIPVEAEK